MARSSSVLPLALLLAVACASSKPATPPPDPMTEPTIVGAITEAAMQGAAEGEAAARVGRRIGRVAGVLAAVFGGPESESIDDTIHRYRNTRDAIIVTSAFIGASHGVVEGAQRGFAMDLQFAELLKIEGLDVTRPFPDQIDVRFAGEPTPELLARIVAVLTGRAERAIVIEGAGDAALDVRDALLELDAPASIRAYRNDHLSRIILQIYYR